MQKVNKASAFFEKRHARQPRPHELADELNMQIVDMLFLLGLAQQTKAFKALIKMGEGDQEITFSDVYIDEDGEDTDHKLEVDRYKQTFLIRSTCLTKERRKC